jgi:tetratricopeptide (TPR) repeat protein
MKYYYLMFVVLVIVLSLTLTSCRPPELEGAVVHYKAGRMEQAYELAMEASQKYPDNAEVWYYLGEVQGKRGEIKEMLESFDKSLALQKTYEGAITLARLKYFNKFYNDGVSSFNAFIKIEDKESEQSKNAANKVIDNFMSAQLIKKDYMANRLISIAYQNLDEQDNALKYLEEAAKVKPDTVLAWIELGFHFNRLQDYTKASEYFKKGLDVEPNNVECITLYAQSLDFAGNKEEAIKAYNKAMELNPEEKALPFNLGLILNKKANEAEDPDKKKELYEQAIMYFEKVYEIDPQLKDVYDLLSTLLLVLEKYDEAEKLLTDGIERFPESSSMWQNLSFLYAKQGRKDEAEKAYQRSKELQ